MAIEYGGLPFKEAVDYLHGKVDVDTKTWTDIWEGQHAKAFVVAGATKDDVLTDLHAAINKAIEKGTTLEEFRKDFDATVARHGWYDYTGGRNWRTRVIYETNMRTAYQAGRYEQLQAVKDRRPYWQYDHSDFVTHPRPEHQAWNGKVLHADDLWWNTHYPPNGWGCRCSVRALSKRDLTRMGKDGPDQAPAIEWKEKTVGATGPNPRTVQVPEGIDPGWGYNVGKSNSGRVFPPQAYENLKEELKNKGISEWVPQITHTAHDVGRPALMPLFPQPVPLSARLNTQDEMVTAFREFLGGDAKQYRVAGQPVVLEADWMGNHTDAKRAEFLPLLDDLLTDPYEVWLNWERHTLTGEVRLATRLIKAYDIGPRGRGLVLMAQVGEGMFRGHTFVPGRNVNNANNQRLGVLLQSKEDE